VEPNILTSITGESISQIETINRTTQDLPARRESSRLPKLSRLLRSNATVFPHEDEFAVLASNLYALCKAKRDREAIAEALDYFDDLLIARRFTDCNRALRELQVAKLSSSVMVSILGITLCAKSKSRTIFFERTFQDITRKKSRRYASELLGKYR
jgi:hypothetical protein